MTDTHGGPPASTSDPGDTGGRAASASERRRDPSTQGAPAGDPLGDVLRWEEAGGTWRVLATAGDAVTVSLCRCDGGEEVDQITSDDAELRVYVSVRPSSED